jgi:hypothetical protein
MNWSFLFWKHSWMGHYITAWPVCHYSYDGTLLSLYYSLASMSLQLCSDQLSSRSHNKNLNHGDWYCLTYCNSSFPWSRPKAVQRLVVGECRSRMMLMLKRLNRTREDRQISQLSSQWVPSSTTAFHFALIPVLDEEGSAWLHLASISGPRKKQTSIQEIFCMGPSMLTYVKSIFLGDANIQ